MPTRKHRRSRAGRPLAAAIASSLLSVTSLAGCGGDDGSKSASSGSGGKAGAERVRIAVVGAPGVITTRSGNVAVRGTVTPGARVSLDAGQARVNGGSFVATIRGLNLGRSAVVIRAAKAGLQPSVVTVQVRRTRSGHDSRRSGTAAPQGAKSPKVRTIQPGRTALGQGGARVPPPPPLIEPFAAEAQAKVQSYLARYYGNTRWFRSLRGLKIEPSGIRLMTGLRKGDPSSERAANEACFAVKRFRLSGPIRVIAQGGDVIEIC